MLFQLYPIVLVCPQLPKASESIHATAQDVNNLSRRFCYIRASVLSLTRGSHRLDLLDECIWLLPWLRNAICFEIGFVLNLSSRSKGCSAASRCSRITRNANFHGKTKVWACWNQKYSFNGLFTNSGLQSWGDLPSNYILERDSPKPLLDRGSIRVDDLLATSMDPREDVIQSDQLLKKIEERLQSLAKLTLLELRRSILLSASLI